MDLRRAIDDLAAADAGVRRAAADRLVAAGAAAVAPVLAVLGDEASPVAWYESAEVLRRIGDPAFAALVETMATAPTAEVARRAGWAFGGLDLADPARYLTVLTHPSAKVRAGATHALRRLKADALPLAPALVPVLGDPDADVRQTAVWAFADMGAGAVAVLREARRTPGPHRRGALLALAETGGWDALGARDQRVVRRLIDLKRRREVPEPMHLCGYWFALPTADQARVLAAFELSDPVAVTMRLGASAWNRDHHGPVDEEHADCARLYVTPVLNGWTLVFGRPPGLAHLDEDADAAALRERCRALSVTFGSAHWYGASCGDDWTAWCLAENGEVIRWYDVFEPDDQVGDPLPAEGGDPDEAYSTGVAARMSVDPAALGADTTVAGEAVIAATPCRAYNPSPRGALDI